MLRRIAVLLLAALPLLAGCGGGGGNGGNGGGGPASAQDVAQVQTRQAQFTNALVNEQSDTLPGFYVDSFVLASGIPKSGMAENFRTEFSTVEIVSLTVASQQFTANADGTVLANLTWRITAREKPTGRTETATLPVSFTWVREAGEWRILYANASSVQASSVRTSGNSGESSIRRVQSAIFN